ncbi:uncharacterized protein YlxW (UPF0749 family) [Kitasatospora herbaricolor]|uniref:DUF881 domain-containing protein n=1 Tax=Kitasatospora herbaricolor TaxID=68217 RepID=UPI002792BD7B|nr:DUF881 domain-containing protein [Kitasatospora herbaricolor]MDQ0307177.1 uncharacterized protein YlxW (UPF0749 family) [Kitasatospora herbaricolor]
MPATPTPSARDGRYNRPDASMSLLTSVMDHGLDEGYAEAAAARGDGRASRVPTTRRGLVTLGLGLALVGVVLTIGAVNAHDAQPALAKERDALVHRVTDTAGAADRLQQQVQELRRKVESTQQQALQAAGDGGLADLAGAVGTGEVSGPGIRLVVEDAAGTGAGGNVDPRQADGFENSGRLRDRDLQLIVNGLWQAGAEAVSINGQRLTALSAIRAAGEAVLVDNRPLVPPYSVLAVGDGPKLGPAFESGVAGHYLHLLQDSYGIKFSLSVQSKVTLPAAVGVTLRTAQPVPSAPASSPAAAPETPGGATGPSGTPGAGPSAPPPSAASPGAHASGAKPSAGRTTSTNSPRTTGTSPSATAGSASAGTRSN